MPKDLEKLLRLLVESRALDLDEEEIADAAFRLRLKRLLSANTLGLRVNEHGALRGRKLIRKSKLKAKKLIISRPVGGNVVKPFKYSAKSGASKRLTAIAAVKSRRRSGSVVVKSKASSSLRSIDLSGSIGTSNVQGFLWQYQRQPGVLFVIDQKPDYFPLFVLGGAYAGDFRQLQITDVKTVTCSQPIYYDFQQLKVPLQAGQNMLAKLTLPQGFQTWMPQTLLLYGAFNPWEAKTGSAQLFTLPLFEMTLHQNLVIHECYLAISTHLTSDSVWDSYGSINGWIELSGMRVPLSSNLSHDAGLMSLEHEAERPNWQKDLSELGAVALGTGFLQAWGDAPLLANVGAYALTQLRILCDFGQPNIVSIGFQILVGNEITIATKKPPMKVVLRNLRLDWLIGFPATNPDVSTYGAGTVAIDVAGGYFANVVWQGSVEPGPPMVLRCYAPAASLAQSALNNWLLSTGIAQNYNVANYGGCMIEVTMAEVRVLVEDVGQDFQRTI